MAFVGRSKMVQENNDGTRHSHGKENLGITTWDPLVELKTANRRKGYRKVVEIPKRNPNRQQIIKKISLETAVYAGKIQIL